MNETTLTIVGNVVDTPNLRRTKNGHVVASFRVGSTQRRFDRDSGGWVDGDKLFVTVTCWRALGENVAQSLRKGQPVIVTGRYYQREYEKDQVLHTVFELDATAVGPDLSRGIAFFEKVARPYAATQLITDADGIPADMTHEYIDAADDEPRPDDGMGEIAAEIDVLTGEVRELATAS